MEHQASAHHEEHPPTTIRQYVIIGLVLAVITAVELWLSYSGLPDGIMIAGLIVLSAIKFIIVAALFMHLRFDHPLFTRMFVFGFVLASTLLFAVLAMFVYGHHENSTREVSAAAQGGGGATHGEAGGSEGEGSEGNGEGGAADSVQGQPVAEFFAANCAACHGQNREGLVGPALTPERLTEGDEVYATAIRDGRPGTAMPPWGGQLNEQDISALVQFITTVEP